MVNALFLRKFNEQIELIEKTIKNSLEKCLNLNISLTPDGVIKPKKASEEDFRVKNIENEKIVNNNYEVTCAAVLPDKKLILGVYTGIAVYNESYRTIAFTKLAHSLEVRTIIGLKNGHILSVGGDPFIKIWRLENDSLNSLYSFEGHFGTINKLIELEDGRLLTCALDNTLKIWDKDKDSYYKCAETLTGHNCNVRSVVEMKDCFVSTGNNELRIWSKSTYECLYDTENIHFKRLEADYTRPRIFVETQKEMSPNNSLSRLDDDTAVLGVNELLYFVDTKNYKISRFEDENLRNIRSIYVNKDKLIFIGNDKGKILCFDPLINMITFKIQVHYGWVSCIIEIEDNQLVASSYDCTISINKYS